MSAMASLSAILGPRYRWSLKSLAMRNCKVIAFRPRSGVSLDVIFLSLPHNEVLSKRTITGSYMTAMRNTTCRSRCASTLTRFTRSHCSCHWQKLQEGRPIESTDHIYRMQPYLMIFTWIFFCKENKCWLKYHGSTNCKAKKLILAKISWLDQIFF